MGGIHGTDEALGNGDVHCHRCCLSRCRLGADTSHLTRWDMVLRIQKATVAVVGLCKGRHSQDDSLRTVSTHKVDIELLDYLKDGTDFSWYFAQVASGAVASQGHFQLEWERTKDLMCQSGALTLRASSLSSGPRLPQNQHTHTWKHLGRDRMNCSNGAQCLVVWYTLEQ